MNDFRAVGWFYMQSGRKTELCLFCPLDSQNVGRTRTEKIQEFIRDAIDAMQATKTDKVGPGRPEQLLRARIRN